MPIRWNIDEVAGLLAEPLPRGMIDLWDAVPPGFKITDPALEAARQASQVAIVQGLTMIDQKVTAAAGLSVGFRPEIFAKLKDLPGFDTLSATAQLAITGNLDLATITQAAVNLVMEIVFDVAKDMGTNLAQINYFDSLGPIVQVVTSVVDIIVTAVNQEAAIEAAEAQANLDCVPPAGSAALDEAAVKSAISMMSAKADWRDLFLPMARPFDPDWQAKNAGWQEGTFKYEPDGWIGFTCCPSTIDGGRVIAPVGIGIGNRGQEWIPGIPYGYGPGAGLLPMCPDLQCHRAIVVPAAGTHLTYDIGRDYPQLSGLGQRAWRILWGRGPAAFAVDGKMIASAWTEYLGAMRRFIGRNRRGSGMNTADQGVCDDWGESGRLSVLQWFFSRLGASPGAWNPDGIYTFQDSLPVKAWLEFEKYQESLLERLMIFYVDAKTCAPEWRVRVMAAQQDALNHPTAVCDINPNDIPDPEFRAAVVAKRISKGAVCYAVAGKDVSADFASASDGPSLAPLGSNPTPIPNIPPLPPPVTSSGSSGPSTTGKAAVTVAVVSALLWWLSKR